MAHKKHLGILFGGRSCEHEVSVTSATSILKAIDRDKYHVHLVGIDKHGHWHLAEDLPALIDEGAVRLEPPRDSDQAGTDVSMSLHHEGNLTPVAARSASPSSLPVLDVVFPVLHGTFGEDGTLQGVLEMAGIPYVGCGVAASALAMDKALAKKVFEAEGIPQAPYHIVTRHRWDRDSQAQVDDIESTLGYPLFVKPANLGSSVGVSKARDRESLATAVAHALEFDDKAVVEVSMENCREIECSVLGNEEPMASCLGEIVPGAEFYNYETKYLDDKSELIIPADLDPDTTRQVQELAVRAFLAVDGSGLARVDFFVHRETGAVTLNEVNTLPGFTPISMYPQLWAHSGISYPELIDRLIELAIERHHKRQSLKRAF